MRSPGILVAGAILFLAGSGVGWSLRALLAPAAAAAEADEAPLEPGQMRVQVSVALAERGELPRVAPAAGEVRAEPGGTRGLISRAAGRTLEVNVAPGQSVQAGDLVARLDPGPLAATVSEAQARATEAHAQLERFEATERDRELARLEADLRRAKGAEELARQARTRTEGLLEKGLASERTLAEARQAVLDQESEAALSAEALAAYRTSGAELARRSLAAETEAADAALSVTRDVLAETEVRAPAAGQVLEVALHPGDWHEAGAPVATLAVAGGRVVVLGVGAERARGLQPGARAWWTDSGGVRGAGTVSSVRDAVSSALGLLDVIVAPDAGTNPGPVGMAVRGEIETGRVTDAILVPEEAIVRTEDRLVVVVAGADDRARVVPVTLLARHAGRAAVSGELAAGDRVVIEAGYNLPDGAGLIVQGPEGAATGEPR